MNHPVEPPTAVKQWTAADVAAARAAGRSDLIDQALRAGQLAGVLGDPTAKPGDAFPTRAMDAKDVRDPARIAARIAADAADRGIDLPALPDHLNTTEK